MQSHNLNPIGDGGGSTKQQSWGSWDTSFLTVYDMHALQLFGTVELGGTNCV